MDERISEQDVEEANGSGSEPGNDEPSFEEKRYSA